MSGLEDLQRIVLVFTLCLPRIVAAFTIIPILSRQVLPGMLRTGVAASLALLIYPLVAATAPATELTLVSGAGVALKEVFIGLVIGYGAAILFWAIESVGFFIDNQRGSSMASSIDPLTGSQTSPLGILLTQAITAIFFVGGGFLVFLGALYDSYRLWPVFSFFPALNWDAIPYFLSLLDRLMALAVLLAAPIIIAMFMAEFGLGLISRFAPQLNVFFLAMPVKSAIGIFLLVLYASLLLRYFDDQLRALPVHFAMLQRLFQ
jgi:type III secretion protein T